MSKALKLITVGVLSGLVSGFFGAGGGIVLIFALSIFLKKEKKKVFAQTAFITAAFAAVSAVIYHFKGNLPSFSSFRYIVPAALGGAIGAILLVKLKLKAVKRIFALTVILGGLIMIFR